jgi:hypothetical protein
MGGLWRLGHEMSGCTFTPIGATPDVESVDVVDTTGLMARVVFHSSSADREVSLGAGDTGLSFAIVTRAAMGTTRTVSFSFAVSSNVGLTTSEPAGYEARVAQRIYSPTFWPAVSWAEIGGVAVLLRQSTGIQMGTPGVLELMAVRDARVEQCDLEGGSGSDTGTHRIEWKLEPASSPAEAELAAQGFNRPLSVETVPLDQAAVLDLPRERSLLSVSGPGVVSALKPADRGNGVILRVVLLPGPVTVTLPPSLVGKTMTRVDIAERNAAPLGTAGSNITFDQGTYGAIATVRFE